MKRSHALFLLLLPLLTLSGCTSLCKHFCDPLPPDAMGETPPDGVLPEEASTPDHAILEIANTNCPMTFHIQTHEPQRDAAGNITGFAWTDIAAPASGAMHIPLNQPVRTYATLSNGCRAHVTISKHGSIRNKRFSSSTPTPPQRTCTAHKEVIWWARNLSNTASGTPRFWAHADCDVCGPATCTGESETQQSIR